jgi:hypothetical protein
VAEVPTNTLPAPATDAPAEVAVAPSESPTALPTPTSLPTVTETPLPRATREPIDVAAVISVSLPPVFVGAGVLLVFVIVAAGLSLVRGPRDI